MREMVKFATAPTLLGMSDELCNQFIGLEVPRSRLDSVGFLEKNVGDSRLIVSAGHTLDPEYIVVEMRELLLAAYRNERYLLAAYLERQNFMKLLVPYKILAAA